MSIKPPTLVQARASDLSLIDRWLVQPDMRRWWGNPMDTQCEMRLGIYCHDDIGRVYLILDRANRPVGLVSLIHARATVGARIQWSSHLPKNAWEIGILIASKTDRRRGYGKKVLVEAQNIVATFSDDPLFAWIKKDNAASLAVFAALGYRQIDNAHIASYRFALFRYDHQRIRGNGTRNL